MRSFLIASGLSAAAIAALTLSVATGAAPEASAAAASVAPLAAPTAFAVDLSHSNILFKCKHLGVSYQWGRFDDFEGSFTLAEDGESSKVSIDVESTSVNSNDPKRDDHLRGPDFFDVKQFPKMTFESTKIEAKADEVFAITGDLTLHGETKSIIFDVTKVGEATHERMGHRAGFEGSFVIDRMDYGIKTYPDMLGHDVTMHFAIEGIAKK